MVASGIWTRISIIRNNPIQGPILRLSFSLALICNSFVDSIPFAIAVCAIKCKGATSQIKAICLCDWQSWALLDTGSWIIVAVGYCSSRSGGISMRISGRIFCIAIRNLSGDQCTIRDAIIILIHYMHGQQWWTLVDRVPHHHQRQWVHHTFVRCTGKQKSSSGGIGKTDLHCLFRNVSIEPLLQVHSAQVE